MLLLVTAPPPVLVVVESQAIREVQSPGGLIGVRLPAVFITHFVQLCYYGAELKNKEDSCD